MPIYSICIKYEEYGRYVAFATDATYDISSIWLNIYAYGNTTHMHKVLGAFLNRRKIRITFRGIVLRFATFRTCNPAPLETE